MTTYTWTDNTMRSGSTCDVDKVADNLMHLKYNAGGLLPINSLGNVTSNFTLDLNKIDTAAITALLTISLPTTGLVSGVENKCILDFTTTSTSSPILPTSLKWSNKNTGQAPTSYSTLSGVKNVLTFITRDGGTIWEAEYTTYGAAELTYTRSNLTANGTLGGSSEACSATDNYSGEESYRAFDSNATGTYYVCESGLPCYLIFYTPKVMKATQINIINYPGAQRCVTNYTIYASLDNANWTTLTSGTNSVITSNGSWSISIPSGVQGFYNYYKLYASSTSSGYGMGISNMDFVGTYIVQ